jgi:hypothetical protein
MRISNRWLKIRSLINACSLVPRVRRYESQRTGVAEALLREQNVEGVFG